MSKKGGLRSPGTGSIIVNIKGEGYRIDEGDPSRATELDGNQLPLSPPDRRKAYAVVGATILFIASIGGCGIRLFAPIGEQQFGSSDVVAEAPSYPTPELSLTIEEKIPQEPVEKTKPKKKNKPPQESGNEVKRINIDKSLSTEQKVKEFTKNYMPAAAEVEKQYGVPRELVIAMAIHETGYGESPLAKEANNFFGIKDNDQWNGSIAKYQTFEEVNKEDVDKYELIPGKPIEDLGNGRVKIYVWDKFRKYGSITDGFVDFGNYITTRRIDGELIYENAFGKKKPREYLAGLLSGTYRYATGEDYAKLVKNYLTIIKNQGQ